MIKVLKGLGMRSEFLYGAALASIVASIGAWGTSRSKEDASAAKAERWGIFVGLWAPTFMGIGNALKVDEK
jgi:hypothetical protein